MTLEAIRDLRCPACGFYAVIREPTRDFCLLCSWEHEHERRVRTLALIGCLTTNRMPARATRHNAVVVLDLPPVITAGAAVAAWAAMTA